jgi:predicted TIM-barrel fold metal-dependent hydrolase
VKRGGLTDRMLADYPNLYGDLAAMSGRNSLARDTEFAVGFLDRHQDKLMFGSDCFCLDGKGGGQTNPLPLIAGKCVARETLTAIRTLASPEVFRKVAWGNATKLLKLG